MSTQTEKLIAYHGNKALKKRTLTKIKAHRLADEIAKGAYVKTGVKPQYCAVGCVLEDPAGGHMRYESEFGIPAQLAYLEDGIFESLPDELAIPWPERFMGAIPVGADLSKVWPQFAVWLMVEPVWGLVNVAKVEDVKAICRRVADGYTRDVEGNPLSDEEVEKLARDVWDVWAAGARDAWDAWAAWGARDARGARGARGAWAARDARAALGAWAAWDAWAAFTVASADKLIELLQAAA